MPTAHAIKPKAAKSSRNLMKSMSSSPFALQAAGGPAAMALGHHAHQPVQAEPFQAQCQSDGRDDGARDFREYDEICHGRLRSCRVQSEEKQQHGQTKTEDGPKAAGQPV